MARLKRIERQRRRTSVRATVMLQCVGRRTVRLSYIVPGASWRADYAIRAKSGSPVVDLSAHAIVTQSTGEPWRNVRLAITTVDLARANVPPRLAPSWVRARKPVDARTVLVRRLQTRSPLRATVSGVAPPRAAPTAPRNAERIAAMARVSIPSDGREVIVPLGVQRPRAADVFETAPKALPYVYRRLTIANPFAFALLPGPLSLFVDGVFIGRTRMPARTRNEPFDVTLGVADKLHVRRYIKTERIERGGALSAHRLVHHYVIQVDNWSAKRRRIRVRENVPVSRLDAVEVAFDERTTPPTTRDVDHGQLSWDVDLAPRGGRARIELSYAVSVPRSFGVKGYE